MLWSTWLVWACKDICSLGFSKWNREWREIGLNSQFAMCKVLCQRYNSHIVSVCTSPSVPRKTRPFFAQTLSCYSVLLALILFPGWTFVTHQKPVWNRESRSMCILIYYTSKRVVLWLRFSRPGSALLQVLSTWRDPRLNRNWIIKQMEEKKTPAAIAVKVSRWVCH